MLTPSFKNLNRRPLAGSPGASTQRLQVEQATGHASEIPTRAQRFAVSLFATQVHERVIFDPSFQNLILSVGSTQELLVTDAVGEAVGEEVGSAVGLDVGVPVGLDVGVPVGEEVGPIGAADGDGEGLIDMVGVLDGASLGTALGSKLGDEYGAVDGSSLGTALGSKLGESEGASLGMSDGN